MGLRLGSRPAAPILPSAEGPGATSTPLATRTPLLVSANRSAGLKFFISLGQAAQRRVRPGGLDRGEPVGGCGIPANWAGTVHTLAVWIAQPSTGGRGNTGTPVGQQKPYERPPLVPPRNTVRLPPISAREISRLIVCTKAEMRHLLAIVACCPFDPSPPSIEVVHLALLRLDLPI